MPSERQTQKDGNTGAPSPPGTTGKGEARADVAPEQSVLVLQSQQTLTERVHGLGQVVPGRPGERKRRTGTFYPLKTEKRTKILSPFH